MADRPALEVVEGELAGAHFVLLADHLVIGRASDCDVCLQNVAGVSRRHAELRLDGDGSAMLKDLGSHNGTLVEGERIGETLLRPGQAFRIGAALLRLVPSGQAAAGAAPPAALTGAKAGEGPSPAEGMLTAAPAAGSSRTSAAPATIGGSGVSPELDAASLLGAAGGGAGRALLSVLLLAALLLALGYGAKALTREGPGGGRYVQIVEVRERRVVFTQRPFEDFSLEPYGMETGEDDPVTLAEFDGMLGPAFEEYAAETSRRRRLTLRFLVVEGQSRTGDEPVWIRLAGASGGVERIPVVVRGRKERSASLALPAEERAGAIRRHRSGAVAMEADGQWYFALRELEAAAELARLENDVDALAELQQSRMRVRTKLGGALRERFLEAARTAFPDAPRRPNYAAALRLVIEAKRMVPDEDSVDWQALDIWQAFLRRLYISSRRR